MATEPYIEDISPLSFPPSLPPSPPLPNFLRFFSRVHVGGAWDVAHHQMFGSCVAPT